MLATNRIPLSVGGRYLNVTEAVDPKLITWENLGRSSFTKFFRYLFSFILISGFFIGTIMVMREVNKPGNELISRKWFIALYVTISNYIILITLNWIGHRRYTKNITDNHIYRVFTISLCQIINFFAAFYE